MRRVMSWMLAVVAVTAGCGGDSGMSAESITWILGTPVLTADSTTFPVEARVSVQVSRHHDNRIDAAPDGTPVSVRCTYRSDGRLLTSSMETLGGIAVVAVAFDQPDIADLTISVANVQRDATVEAMVDGQVRLVGG